METGNFRTRYGDGVDAGGAGDENEGDRRVRDGNGVKKTRRKLNLK